MKVVYRGLVLESKKGCKYYNVTEGSTFSLIENLKTSTLTLTYPKGSTCGTIHEILGIPCIEKDLEMIPLSMPKLFSEVIVSLNGLKLRKLTTDSHTINLIIVEDCESRVVQNYNYTTIVISKEDALNDEFVDFLFYSGRLKYLEPVGKKPANWAIRNFPKIIIKDKNIVLESDNTEVFSLRRRYDDYVIRAIDYQNQFVLELRRILDDYGLEFVRYNKEATLSKTSYVTYQFNQTPSMVHHPNIYGIDNRIISQRLPVELSMHTPDMVMFFDFKNKFNNVDLLSNFCEFVTKDKYGQEWVAAIKWLGNITEDFNHVYQSDENSNFSYQCQFRCELYFYEVLDAKYKFLEEIVFNLDSEESK